MAKTNATNGTGRVKGFRVPPAPPTSEIVDGDALARDVKLYKGIVLDQHRKEEGARLRAGLIGWWARTMSEVQAVDNELRPGGQLAEALGADEAAALRSKLDQVWHLMAAEVPECVPAFLKGKYA